MEPAVRVEVIAFVALAIVCLVSAYASWQTRRLLIRVFGENPRAARLTERGYYVSVAELTPLGSSGARAIPPAPVPAPAVEPAEGAAPAASKRVREFPQPSLAPCSPREPLMSVRSPGRTSRRWVARARACGALSGSPPRVARPPGGARAARGERSGSTPERRLRSRQPR